MHSLCMNVQTPETWNYSFFNKKKIKKNQNNKTGHSLKEATLSEAWRCELNVVQHTKQSNFTASGQRPNGNYQYKTSRDTKQA